MNLQDQDLLLESVCDETNIIFNPLKWHLILAHTRSHWELCAAALSTNRKVNLCIQTESRELSKARFGLIGSFYHSRLVDVRHPSLFEVSTMKTRKQPLPITSTKHNKLPKLNRYPQPERLDFLCATFILAFVSACQCRRRGNEDSRGPPTYLWYDSN